MSVPSTSPTPPMSLRERQKQRRRHRIYTVAIQMFKERGFTGATATDIARLAHVSRGTFFNYYPYKEAVLLDYGAEVIGKLAERAQEQLDSGQEPLDVLRFVWRELAGITISDKDLIPPLVYELINPDPERARVAYETLPLSAILGKVLARVPGLRPDVSLERIAFSLTDAYLMTALRWTAYRPDTNLEEDLDRALTIVLDGAFAR
ncbi:MAG TPA: TetR/AcrR family transcriptional regulator [Deinococcales bacterium]|nr:TetR/AcrR family transcriptional regulator [Deinococcales bacterium]